VNARALIVASLLAAFALQGCSSPQPLVPPRQTAVTLEGNTVVWATSEPTLGEVRFGRRPGAYTAVAYPPAAGRADRAYGTSHRVPLLTAMVGDTVWLQVVDENADGSVSASAEQWFRIASHPATHPLLAWTMIDVGFGDSHLLTLPVSGRRVLVDAGERRDAENVERYLGDAGVTRLDAVLATHIHEDHIGGMVGESHVALDGVVGTWDVGTLLDAPDHSAERQAYNELVALTDARHIPRQVVRAGETDQTNPALAWDADVHVAVLNAGYGRSLGGTTESDWINNDSIVLRITYGDVNLLLGADATGSVENPLVAAHTPLESEVLKVHHHGHSNASEPSYLVAVKARVGLVPICSYESYGNTLPSQTVLDRLRGGQTDIYCSDRAEPLGLALGGDAGFNVTLVTDGVSYQIAVAPSATHHYSGEQLAAAGPARAAEGAIR
jgi:beta-lactamase superfamily II metal-dependent hydrolase